MTSDPVEEFEVAIAEERRLHAMTVAEGNPVIANEHAARWASAVRRLAGIATRHGPAIIARLRAAEAVVSTRAMAMKPRWERWRLYQDQERCPWLLIAGKHPEGKPLVDCNSVVVIASLEWRGLMDSAPWSLKLGMHQSPRGFDTAEAAAAWTSEMLGDDLPLPVGPGK